ncbi:YkgJ family cysteine cluster protein [Desulfogranum japonicum]|uniref:YkgJ family cysteine cluster protein n=1 Tax=Desulfogranum japonicum TaxID=231447 RepID=UPI000418B81A|nr:YkgJ family cysteine cluster protein [Desulfogranum japonicum]
MGELFLPPELSCEIAEIYATMAESYDQVAKQISLTCQGCPDNCCDSYFQHYTYCEWAYLWEGIRKLDDDQLDHITAQAKAYVHESTDLISKQIRPQIPCPLLSEEGLCGLYAHRLMICRTHGVPATLTRPDGQHMRFPGCFRCQEIVKDRYAVEADAPAMERTILYQRLAQLESRFLGHKRHLYPRIKMTIAEMIVKGPPQDIKSCIKGQEDCL